MPEHGVWSELAVSEASRQQCSSADYVPHWLRAEIAVRLAAVCSLLPPLPLEELTLEAVSNDVHRDGKHELQEDSLVAHSLLAAKGKQTWVDLGCGRGCLSEQLQLATGGYDSHLLVDRNPMKRARCRDGSMRARARGGTVTRLVADVSTLDIDAHTIGSVVAVSKHLCGCATDLALKSVRPHTLLVATCCHHLCTWETYASPDFLETIGVSRGHFDAICRLAPWASIPNDDEGHYVSVCQVDAAEATSWELPALSLLEQRWRRPDEFAEPWRDTLAEKQALGKRCKLFLDAGRVHALARDYKLVRLVRYTTRSVEDRLLIAM